MFDTYYHAREVAVPYEKTVKEYKAPTDDSIRLYHEFVQKAQTSVLDAFKLSSTCLEIAVTVQQRWEAAGEFILYKCIFNDEEIFGKVETNCRFESREEVTKLVVEAVANNLAKYMFKHLCVTTPEYRKYL